MVLLHDPMSPLYRTPWFIRAITSRSQPVSRRHRRRSDAVERQNFVATRSVTDAIKSPLVSDDASRPLFRSRDPVTWPSWRKAQPTVVVRMICECERIIHETAKKRFLTTLLFYKFYSLAFLQRRSDVKRSPPGNILDIFIDNLRLGLCFSLEHLNTCHPEIVWLQNYRAANLVYFAIERAVLW